MLASTLGGPLARRPTSALVCTRAPLAERTARTLAAGPCVPARTCTCVLADLLRTLVMRTCGKPAMDVWVELTEPHGQAHT